MCAISYRIALNTGGTRQVSGFPIGAFAIREVEDGWKVDHLGTGYGAGNSEVFEDPDAAALYCLVLNAEADWTDPDPRGDDGAIPIEMRTAYRKAIANADALDD
jgi:hypothetical protein